MFLQQMFRARANEETLRKLCFYKDVSSLAEAVTQNRSLVCGKSRIQLKPPGNPCKFVFMVYLSMRRGRVVRGADLQCSDLGLKSTL